MFLALILAGPAPVLEARDKGDKDLKAAEEAVSHQDWDRALDLYMSAMDKNPNNVAYALGMRRARFQAGQMHVNRGQKLRTEGKVQEAMAEFQRAIIADSSSAIAIQELKRTQVILEQQKAGGTPQNPSEAGMTPAERARRASDQKVASMEAPPELKPIVGMIQTIKINNQPPKVLYETIGKMAGINVVFDPQYTAPTRNSNVDLANMPIEDAFDYLAMLTHTFWKPISTNTIFVTEDNVTKRRDYEDEVVRVFYVTNATSVQEFQEIATAIRTVAEIRRVFTYNAQKALIVRGSRDQVALTEKLIHDLDKPKSEVVIDVIVLQVNSTYSRTLAATLYSQGTAGLQAAITFTGGSTTTVNTGTTGTSTGTSTGTGSGTVGLSQLSHISINQWSTTLPGAILTAVMSDARTKTVNKPQVRVSDGMKVDLKIGQRIPYATGSFSSGVSVSSSVSPLVSTQFNYADVGLNLSIQPQVHSQSEVTLHIEVEVSSVDQYVNIGGISQPVIGQSKNTADIRMKEGEINILSGLSQNSNGTTLAGTPGITNIPILGQVFGSSTKNQQKSELMIALIPHIVRTPDYSAENLRGIYAGSDQVVKINYAPKVDEGAAAPAIPPGSNPPAALPPATVPPVTVPPATVPPVAPPATAPQIPPTASRPGVSPAAPAAPPGQARVRFAPESVQAVPGAIVQVAVQIDNAADLFSASPMRIKYDASILRLNDAAPGEIFTRDGARITSVKDIRNEVGEATLTVARAPGSEGVSGSGAVMMLNFTAVGKGTGTVSLPEFNLKNSQLQPLPAAAAELPVKVN
ncbi:MAG TPA: cohesin domain-containing protein [Bryobacteraceae bacterium]|nr:cohesin domain-containing protein [Bryobacteraceae bacterium]